MDVRTLNHDTSTNIFLTAAVVLANVDYTGLTEYALKAAIGGVLWMGFKLAGDWIGQRVANRGRRK